MSALARDAEWKAKHGTDYVKFIRAEREVQRRTLRDRDASAARELFLSVRQSSYTYFQI
jgi:hypothetical protein